jgi:CBS domain-containing protein
MTRDVATIPQGATLLEALRLMIGKDVSGLPVVDAESHLVGILTEGDLLRRAEIATERRVPWWKNVLFGPSLTAEEYVRSHARKVASVMTRTVHCVAEDASLETIVHIMERDRVKRVPVIRDSRLVGIVSRRDLLRKLAARMKEAPATGLSDADIAQAIDTELGAQPWSARQNLSIKVRDGTVDLAGVVLFEEQREALKMLVQNTPGVRGVIDQLIFLDPYCGTPIPDVPMVMDPTR